jgi:hypothetical protein
MKNIIAAFVALLVFVGGLAGVYLYMRQEVNDYLRQNFTGEKGQDGTDGLNGANGTD